MHWWPRKSAGSVFAIGWVLAKIYGVLCFSCGTVICTPVKLESCCGSKHSMSLLNIVVWEDEGCQRQETQEFTRPRSGSWDSAGRNNARRRRRLLTQVEFASETKRQGHVKICLNWSKKLTMTFVTWRRRSPKVSTCDKADVSGAQKSYLRVRVFSSFTNSMTTRHRLSIRPKHFCRRHQMLGWSVLSKIRIWSLRKPPMP